MSDTSDQKLAREIARGNTAAEGNLLDRFRARIERQVRSDIGYHNHDGEDVINDILLAVLESLRNGNYQASKSKLSTYIYAITKNVVAAYFRNKAKERAHFEKSDPQKQATAPDNPGANPDLKRALKKLKPEYQRVLYYRYYLGMSMKEIAEKVNLTEQQVINRHYQAIQILRNRLNRDDYLPIILLLFAINVQAKSLLPLIMELGKNVL